MSSDHIQQGELLKESQDLERRLNAVRNGSARSKWAIRRQINRGSASDEFILEEGFDPDNEQQMEMLYEAAEPRYQRAIDSIKRGAQKHILLPIAIGLIGVAALVSSVLETNYFVGPINMSEGEQVQKAEENTQKTEGRAEETLNRNALEALTTATDTDCNSYVGRSEFRDLYESQMGKEFPWPMDIPAVYSLDITIDNNQGNSIDYRLHFTCEETDHHLHYHLLMSRDTALQLAEGIPDPCSIQVPNQQ